MSEPARALFAGPGFVLSKASDAFLDTFPARLGMPAPEIGFGPAWDDLCKTLTRVRRCGDAVSRVLFLDGPGRVWAVPVRDDGVAIEWRPFVPGRPAVGG